MCPFAIASHHETQLVIKPVLRQTMGYAPPYRKKAPPGFGCQGPRRPFTGGAACLGLDGQRTAV